MSAKVFVSSTFEDLKEHRAKAIDDLRSAGLRVEAMEDFPAAHARPKNLVTEKLNGCDLCVLLIAWRRGHLPERSEQSITQIEYQAALDRQIDVLVFMLEDEAAWPPHLVDNDPEVERWRRSLRESHTVGFFGSNPESLRVLAPVIQALEDPDDLASLDWPAKADMNLGFATSFEAGLPAYFLDKYGAFVGWNTGFELVQGPGGSPERGTRVDAWFEAAGHQLLSSQPEATASDAGALSRAAGHRLSPILPASRNENLVEMARVELNTSELGKLEFYRITVPVVDPESGGANYWSVVLSPRPSNDGMADRFLKALRERLVEQVRWSRYAVAYDRVLNSWPPYRQLVELHCQAVAEAPPGRVLDLGAGTGNITLEILKDPAGRKVTAIDLDTSMLLRLQGKCSDYIEELRLKVRRANVERSAHIPAGTVGAVVMNNLLFLLEDPGKLLRRAHTWLQDGGVVSIHVPSSPERVETLLDLVLRDLEDAGCYDEEMQAAYGFVYDWNVNSDREGELRRFQPEELGQLLLDAGFSDIETRTDTYLGSGLFATARKRRFPR